MGSPFHGEAAISPTSGYAGNSRACKMFWTLPRRDGLDLDHEIRTIQFRYLDQRHRGRRRRRDGSKESISRLAIAREIIHVGEEHRQLHEIACGASARLQGKAEVAKYLFCLDGKIILADQAAIPVECGLAGDENDAAGGDLDDLRIAGRRAELGRIDAGNRCFTYHSNSSLWHRHARP